MQTTKTRIKKIYSKTGIGKKGSWQLTKLLCADSQYYSTFDPKLAQAFIEGDTVIIESEPSGKEGSNTITSIIRANPEEEGKAGEAEIAADEAATPPDTEAIVRQRLQKATRMAKEELPGYEGMSEYPFFVTEVFHQLFAEEASRRIQGYKEANMKRIR